MLLQFFFIVTQKIPSTCCNTERRINFAVFLKNTVVTQANCLLGQVRIFSKFLIRDYPFSYFLFRKKIQNEKERKER